MTRPRRMGVGAAGVLVAALLGCSAETPTLAPISSTTGSVPPTTVAAASTTTPTSTPTSTTTSPTSTPASTTTTTPARPRRPGPLTDTDGVYRIRWGQLAGPPGFDLVDTDTDNPFWIIHTDAERDGYYFSLELYTTGYGARWTGQLGEVEIACSEPPPGDESTGVCPHFDPDGPGPLPDLIGFTGSGSITIDRLDPGGFDITVNELAMAFDLSIAPFRLRGRAP